MKGRNDGMTHGTHRTLFSPCSLYVLLPPYPPLFLSHLTPRFFLFRSAFNKGEKASYASCPSHKTLESPPFLADRHPPKVAKGAATDILPPNDVGIPRCRPAFHSRRKTTATLFVLQPPDWTVRSQFLTAGANSFRLPTKQTFARAGAHARARENGYPTFLPTLLRRVRLQKPVTEARNGRR